MTDKEYLQSVLDTKKLELRETKINYRIAIAEYNLKVKMLDEQIYSIERQLDNTK